MTISPVAGVRSLALDELTACMVGAISVEPTQTGMAIHRSSARTRAQLADPAFDFPSGAPSGVRIEALTDADWVELDLALTRVGVAGVAIHGTSVDLIVDGELHPPIPITSTTVIRIDITDGSMTVEPGAPQTFRFPVGTAGVEKRVEIWLPHAASTELLAARVPSDASFRPLTSTAPVWVHHGSSISHCSEVERPTQTWPAIIARQSGHSLINLGIGGQCHLDQGMARTIRDLNADAISLEVGINIAGGDTMHERTFPSAFHGFLDTIRDGAPDTPILIISPIYCGPIETHPGPLIWAVDGKVHATERPAPLQAGALSLARVRELLEQHIGIRRQLGDSNIHLINGLDLFGPDDANDLPDGLHPNTAGYARIAARLSPLAFGEHGALTHTETTTSAIAAEEHTL